MSVYSVHSARLRKAAQYVAGETRQQADLNATELANIFFEGGFFAAAGYGFAGDDNRLEQLPSPSNHVVLIRTFTGAALGLIEMLPPGTVLNESAAHLQQVTPQLLGQLPAVAGLTNGAHLLLFAVQDGYLAEQLHDFDLAHLSLDEAAELAALLSHCRVDWKRQLRHPHVSTIPLDTGSASAA